MRALLLAVVLVGCGPSWRDVVRHPDGTYEDTRTHECWDEVNEPVRCPT